MSAHTAAPWRRNKYGSVVDFVGRDVLFRGVSILSTGGADRMAEAEANTDLVAAAPQLLVGLIEACAAIEQHARDCFGIALHHYDDFDACWEDNDPEDYARWVRLKALAGSV